MERCQNASSKIGQRAPDCGAFDGSLFSVQRLTQVFIMITLSWLDTGVGQLKFFSVALVCKTMHPWTWRDAKGRTAFGERTLTTNIFRYSEEPLCAGMSCSGAVIVFAALCLFAFAVPGGDYNLRIRMYSVVTS